MTRVTFRSKVDWWLLAVLVAAAAGSLAALAALAAESLRQALAFSPVLLLSVGLPIWLLRTTTYTLGDDELVVRSGPFTWRVPLREIHAVSPTRNPLSSPALSLDRLRIEYGRRAIMISPDDKTHFLEELQKRLPRPLTATIRP